MRRVVNLARGLSMAATTLLAGALTALVVALLLLSSADLAPGASHSPPPSRVSQVR